MIRPRAIGAAVVLFLSAPALAQSPPPSDSTVTLPTPTGSHPVGARRFHWVDAQRPELSPHVASRPRELLVRVWYPAATRNGVPEPYLPQLETYRDSGCIGPRTAGVAPRVRHAALRDAPPARGTARHPVVVFSTGNGEMEYMYTALMEELASHGFITVLVPHPGIADVVYPDGRVLHRYRRMFDPKPDGWEASLPATLPATLKRAMYDTMYTESAGYLAADIRFVLDQLERMDRTPGDPLGGRIDLSRVATSGHSHGGLIAVEAAATDPRVKACFQLDGAAFGPVRERGLTKPHLLIRPAFDNDGTPRGVAQNQILGSLRADGYEVNIAGAQHRSFMDVHFLLPDQRGSALDPGRVLTIVSAYGRAFLDRYLSGRDSPLLREPARHYPEVHLRALRFLAPAPYDSLRSRAGL